MACLGPTRTKAVSAYSHATPNHLHASECHLSSGDGELLAQKPTQKHLKTDVQLIGSQGEGLIMLLCTGDAPAMKAVLTHDTKLTVQSIVVIQVRF